jgi:hypothetical protein
MAKYKLHNHIVTLGFDGSVTCDTCSLSAAVVAIIPVMYEHHIYNCTVNGAEIKRA